MAIVNSAGIVTYTVAPVTAPTANGPTFGRIEDTNTFVYWNGTSWTSFEPLVVDSFPKRYAGILTGTNGANPTVSVATDTLAASLVWARTGEGVYTGTGTNAFPLVTVINITLGTATEGVVIRAVRTSANVITISTFASDGTTPADFIGTLNLSVIAEV